MNAMRTPTFAFLVPAPTPQGASSASVPLALSCLTTGGDASILARASASPTLKTESVLYPKPSTPPRQNAVAARCQARAGGTRVSCAPKMMKLPSRIYVHTATGQSLVFMTHVKMSMSVLRAQAFAQMVSASTLMDLSDVSVQWATTWITLESGVWTPTSAPSATPAGTGRAPT